MIRKSERRGRNDQMYAFVSFSDPTGMFEVMLFPEVLAAARPLLEAGKSLLITASAEWDGDELKLRAATIIDLDARRRRRARAWWCGWTMPPRWAPLPANCPAGQGHCQFRGAGRGGRGSGDRAEQTAHDHGILRSTIAAIPGVVSVEAV